MDKRRVLYDINNKKTKKVWLGIFPQKELAISNRHIATINNRKNIYIYDYDFNHIHTIARSPYDYTAIAYSEDGNTLIGALNRYIQVDVYDVKNNYEKKGKAYIEHDNVIGALAFIDNKTAISSGGRRYKSDTTGVKIDIWSLEGKVKEKIKSFQNVGSMKYSVGISGDKIVWGNKLWSKAEKKNKKTFGPIIKSINLKDFSISNKIENYRSIKTTNNGYTLSTTKNRRDYYPNTVLEIRKNEKLIQKIVKGSEYGERHSCYGWYKDFIISGGSNGWLMVYNKNGKPIASLKGHDAEIWAIALDGDRLVSAGEDQTIKIWDLSALNNLPKKRFVNGEWFNNTWQKWLSKNHPSIDVYKKEDVKKLYEMLIKANDPDSDKLVVLPTIDPILNLFITNDNKYIAWTKEGFFDASKGAEQYIGYHINQGSYKEAEFVTVENLYTTFYRPDLIQKALKGEKLDKYARNINIDKLLKDGLAPEVKILTQTKKTTNPDLDLQVQVCPKGKGGYDNLALTINDVPVQVITTSRALKIKKPSKRDDCFTYDQTISLASGKNKIGFKATNRSGTIESKVDYIDVTFDDSKLRKNIASKLRKVGDESFNDLHILAIAINKYKDKELQLNYSINDAKGMLQTIQSVANPLFKKVHTYKLFDTKVTKENIVKAFKDIKSNRDDVFLLYIAGHGKTDQYNGNYYYIPYNFINKNDDSVRNQGVGQQDFMLGLSQVSALKSLVLLDTCESGGFVEADIQKTTTNRLAKATGRATISASSKSQVALEGYNDHGVFTYTLLEALKGKGYKGDNKITTNELADHVELILPNRTFKKWGYRQRPQKSMYGIDFTLGKQ